MEREPGLDREWDDDRDGDWYGDTDRPPAWFAGQHLPDDARRMGLTHHVPDGAILDFAGRLDPAKGMHRVTAWVLLLVFGLPVALSVMRVFALL